MPQNPQAPFISSTEASKRFNLTNDHIGLLCRKGKVAGTLLGRLWYVNEVSLAEYIKKNAEAQAVRHKTLSKQWSTAWTAGLLALAFFGGSAIHANAQVPRGAELRIEHRAIMQVPPTELVEAPVEKDVDAIENSPTVPAATEVAGVAGAPELKSGHYDVGLMKEMAEGVFAIGDMLQGVMPHTPKREPTFHIIYAKPISNVAEDTSTTLQNLAAANELLGRVNANMFGLYADALGQFGMAAVFDADAASYVADRIFGEFGRQFVNDAYAARDVQTHLYAYAAAALQVQFDHAADVVEETPTFDQSLSVASAGAGGEDISLDSFLENTGLAAVWDGYVNFLAYTFFIPKDVFVAMNAPVPPALHLHAYELPSVGLSFASNTGLQSGSVATSR